MSYDIFALPAPVSPFHPGRSGTFNGTGVERRVEPVEFIFTYPSVFGPQVRRFQTGFELLAYTSGFTKDGKGGQVDVVVDTDKQIYVLKAA